MKWISVTGLDGSGKTTLVKNLAKYYEEEKGLVVKTFHLPYDLHLVREVLPTLSSSYADRLLFALDNHIFAEKLKQLKEAKVADIVITQRSFFDSFVHGAVQGFSYSFIGELNKIADLPQVDIMIHLVANADTAYARIMNDPDADKFEYPRYIRKQEEETRNAYYALMNRHPDLAAFISSKNTLIDTTRITTDETFEKAISFLDSVLS